MSTQTDTAARPAATGTPVGCRVLAVGHTPVFRDFARHAEENAIDLTQVPDAPAAVRELAGPASWNAVVVLLDDDAEDQMAWWKEILARTPARPRLVALAANPTIGFALRATGAGVFDVLPIPLDSDKVANLILRLQEAENETTLPLPSPQTLTVGSHEMVSESPSMLPVFRTIAQVGPTTATALIAGQSGTGKELVARAIHLNGPRSGRPFVALNCAAIPENLLESELFGHEKGAFSGAVARKVGRFERATGGTLFLDEIGDMSLPLQGKILRAIQEREVERVGGTEPIPVDIRLIAATHRDLQALIADGRFREDLYYRLAVVTIRLPPLAQRDDDIFLLAGTFLREFGERYGKTFEGITDRALELLRAHEWMGNVRELRNVIERAVLMADGGVLRAQHLPEEWRTSPEPVAAPAGSTLGSLREMEARHITRVLAHTAGQIGEAADILGIHRNTLARKIREYGL